MPTPSTSPVNLAILITTPAGAVLDVTSRAGLDDMGQITFTIERNLHSFRSADASLRFDNGDDFFTELFEDYAPADRWRLEIRRNERTYFRGVLVPGDTIIFDDFDKVVDITFVDERKLMEDVSAEGVARTTTIYITDGAGNTAGATTITLESTTGLFNNDILSSGGETEYTIINVLSATQVVINPALESTLADGTRLLLQTPFHRFKKPEFLIGALLDAAGMVARRIDLTTRPGEFPIISEVSKAKLDASLSNGGADSFVQRNNLLEMSNGLDCFTQDDPEDDWVDTGTSRVTVDWTPYFKYADGEPSLHLQSPTSAPQLDAWDFKPAASTSTQYVAITDNAGAPKTVKIRKRTSTDGVIWSGLSDVVTLASGSANGYHSIASLDYDPVRNLIYWSWMELSPGTLKEFGIYDLNTSTKTVKSTTTFLKGLRYSREVDYCIGGVQTVVGFFPNTSRVQAWRGQNLLYDRDAGWDLEDGPNFHTARFFNGAWYVAGGAFSIGNLFITKDEWQTHTMLEISDGTPELTICNNSVRIRGATFEPVVTDRIFILADAFVGVVDYADFSDMSVSEALDEIAVLINGVFRLDRQGVPVFSMRAPADPGNATILDGKLTAKNRSGLWVETYDKVTCTGQQSVEASVGDSTGPARELSISCRLASSIAVASGIAAAALDFFGRRRMLIRASAPDDDELEIELMDAASLDGRSFLFYEIQVTLPTFEIDFSLLENT